MAQEDPKDKATQGRSRSPRTAKASQQSAESGATATGSSDQAQAVASNVSRVVAGNPIPAAMVWIGVGWLALKALSGGRPGTASQPTEMIRETIGSAANTATESVGTVVTSAQGVVGRVAGRAQAAVGSVSEQAPRVADQVGNTLSSGASRAQSGLGQVLETNPLLLSAAGIAGGVALGLIAPTSSTEAEALAAPTKELVTRAEEVATQAIDKVEQAVGQSGNGRRITTE